MESDSGYFSLRRILSALWVIGLAALALLAFQPAATGLSRGSGLLLLLGLWLTVFRLGWRRTVFRWLWIGLLLMPGGLLVVPWPVRGHTENLRASYVRHLRDYSGCEYYWGGESRGGIDCSGLIRRGMIDACLEEGWSRRDPELIQRAFSLWWNDTSAEALGQEYHGLTRLVEQIKELRYYEHGALNPGVLAVTADGKHIMAHLGGGQWIEADPGENKVITLQAATSKSPWLGMRMRLLEWSMLLE